MNTRSNPMRYFLGLSVVASAVCVAALSGCNAAGKTDDTPRLEAIDAKLNGGDFEVAKTEAAKYVEEYPNSCQGWGVLGWAHVKTNELEKATECFDKSLSINPRWENAHVGKGATFRKQGDNANARRCYEEAIRISPKNAEAFGSLLVIEIAEGNDAKAVEYGEKAWALRKNLASIPANLAIAYHLVGNTAKRDEFYQHAERLKYHRLDTLQDILTGKKSIR